MLVDPRSRFWRKDPKFKILGCRTDFEKMSDFQNRRFSAKRQLPLLSKSTPSADFEKRFPNEDFYEALRLIFGGGKILEGETTNKSRYKEASISKRTRKTFENF